MLHQGQTIKVRGTPREVKLVHFQLSLKLSTLPHKLWIKFADSTGTWEKFESDAHGTWAELEEME